MSIADVLMAHGAERVPSGGGWRSMKCPYHEDSRPSAAVNTESGGFVCHACSVKGDALALIQLHDNVDFKTALLRAETVYGGSSAAPQKEMLRERKQFRPKRSRGR